MMNIKNEITKIKKELEDLMGLNEFKAFIYRGRDAFRKDRKRLAPYKNAHVIIISPAKPKEVEVNEID